MKKRFTPLILILTAFHAEAIVITLDPDPARFVADGPDPLNSSTRIAMPFNEFNGTALNGQDYRITFDFTGDSFIRLFSATPDPGFLLLLQTDSAPEFPGFLDSRATGTALDTSLNPLGTPSLLGQAHSDSGDTVGGFSVASLSRPVDIGGVQMDFTLPITGNTITSAELRLTGNDPFFIAAVGPGRLPDDIRAVPESGTTLILFSLACAGLVTLKEMIRNRPPRSWGTLNLSFPPE
jgi:hypothetical protein